MKKHRFKFKQENILCHRCVINAAKILSLIPGIEEFNIDINSKVIQVKCLDNEISKDIICKAVNDSIISGRTRLILH